MTLDERNDWPSAWTPDSKAILFFSDRSEKWNVYEQALDRDSAEPLVATPQVDLYPRLSPDGAWVVYKSYAKPGYKGPSAASQLRRVPVSGGPSQFVLTAHGLNNHGCARAPATLCLVGETTDDQKQIIFTTFDPVLVSDQIGRRAATASTFQVRRRGARRCFTSTSKVTPPRCGSRRAVS